MRRQVRGGVLAAAVACAVVMLGTGVASAGSGWAIQSTYAPPIPNQDTALWDVSCSAANACMAIGDSPRRFISETWNGTKWSPRLNASPGGGAVAHVSCAGASACTLLAGGPHTPLALRWNGTRWLTQQMPGSGSAGYADVSCPRALFCMAVGGAGTLSKGTTAAATWDGKAWSTVSTPSTGKPFSVLTHVSCVTPADCVAVGEEGTLPSQVVPLIETWNGIGWTIQKTPALTSNSLPQLNSVSCATADSCTTIGTHQTSSAEEPLVEHWNGTSWALQTVPGAANAGLFSVSCPTATSCTAAGERVNSSHVQVTLAAHWNGTTWALQNPPNPKGATSSQFNAVSCPASTVCEAAGMIHVNGTGGRFRDKTLIEGN